MTFVTNPIVMLVKSYWPDGSYREVWAKWREEQFKFHFDKPGICNNPADFEQYMPVANPMGDHVIGNYTNMSDEQYAAKRKERLQERQKQRADAEQELRDSLKPFLGDISDPIRGRKDTDNDK